MKKAIALVALFISLSSLSQGFMGKRFTIAASLSTNFCRTTDIEQATRGNMPGVIIFGETKLSRRVIMAEHLDIAYCFNRQWELTASLTARPIEYATFPFANQQARYYATINKIPVIETMMDIGVRKYIRKAIAPIGVYLLFGIGQSKARTVESADSLTFQSEWSNQASLKVRFYNTSWQNMRYYYGVGMKKIFNLKYFFQMECMFAFPLTRYSVEGANFLNRENDILHDFMYSIVDSQFQNHNYFYAKAGAGLFFGKSKQRTQRN